MAAVMRLVCEVERLCGVAPVMFKSAVDIVDEVLEEFVKSAQLGSRRPVLVLKCGRRWRGHGTRLKSCGAE